MEIEEYVADLRRRQEKVRPEGIPSEVCWPLGEVTLPGHVEEWASRRPGTVALAFPGGRVTYAELADQVSRIAGWLESVGVQPGDRVAVYLPNTPQFVIAMLAILRTGAVHVPVNPMFQAAELAYELSDSGAEVVVTLDSLLPTLDAIAGEVDLRHVLVTGADQRTPDGTPPLAAAEGVTAWSDAVAGDPGTRIHTDLDALAALNYTGGTTGMPKGCEHTQRHMIYTAASTATALRLDADRPYVSLCYLPIFWIAGENLGILNPLVLGGTSVLLPRWDAGKVLDAIEEYGASTIVGTVENYLELLDRDDIAERDLSSLVDPMAVSFVRKLTPDVRRRWAEGVGAHSVLREAAYGMTETHTFDCTPYGLSEGDKDLNAEPIFVGVPVPGTDVAVVAPGSGEPAPLGEVGAIIVRSPSVTTGYWRKPEATAAQLRDGWLYTGDNGRIDEEGCLHFLGRDKDMIKVKGMSVFPAEVEMLLVRHPEVRTAAVVPAEDREKGQVPVAFVSLEPGSTVDAEQLCVWARENMAAYKVPILQVVGEFPMTTTGKIRKVELAERAQGLVGESR